MLPSTSCLKCRIVSAIAALALINVGLMSECYASGTLVYWQNFDGGDGVADVGVGNLGSINGAGTPPAATLFSNSGGVFGGSYDASSNTTGTGTAQGIASTSVAGGSLLSALPNQTGTGTGSMNQFTISFWLKTQTFSGNVNAFGRVLILGAAGTADAGVNVNSIAFSQISTNGLGPTKLNPYFGNADLTAGHGIGDTNVANEWTFFAVSYDGTSSNGDNSAIQLAATGSSINGQFYRGTDTAASVRSELPIVTTVGAPSSASRGAINFGSSAVLFLANRSSLTRALDGWLDDVRIYDSVLTAADVEGVRQQGLLGVTSSGLAGDYNSDGVVDGGDYVVWRKGGQLANEVDNPGTVNDQDYTEWRARFGNPSGSGTALGVTEVPEPAASILGLATLAAAVLFPRNRRWP